MTAPWPGDSASVVRWFRDTIDESIENTPEIRVEGFGRVEITADLAGTDLETLAMDATGLRLRFDPAASGRTTPDAATGARTPEVADPKATPEPLDRRTGVLRTLRLTAAPLRIERTDVKIDLQAFDVPIQWQTFSEPVEAAVPSSIHALVPDEALDGALDGARATFEASIRARDLSPLITSVLRPALREGGVHLTRARVEVAGGGAPDSIRVTAFAGLRWKLLPASVRVDAGIRVGADGVITVRTLTLASRNPLVKAVLLFARKPLRETVGRSIDLNEALRDSGIRLRVHDLRVTTGERLGIAGRLA